MRNSYLGRYVVREKKAPAGLLRNRDTQEFEFHYDENGTADTQVSLSFTGKTAEGYRASEKRPWEPGKRLLALTAERGIEEICPGAFRCGGDSSFRGRKHSEGRLLEILWCDEEGNAASTVDLPYGSVL